MVECGIEAIEIVKQHPFGFFDVILVDLNMPIMDGFECAKLITQLWERPTLSKCLRLSEMDLCIISESTMENPRSASIVQSETLSLSSSLG